MPLPARRLDHCKGAGSADRTRSYHVVRGHMEESVSREMVGEVLGTEELLGRNARESGEAAGSGHERRTILTWWWLA